ncbi:hypothetical protein [Chondromyces crocatus]|uniref:Lipoprotein n=1 Tax=Chondromyces crocatus TaxID=52 RepID=A0A0K1ECB6_CHOCO|nr:hypothetical protein [Chondromyces crocatus]AKT38526.1 uncharacterized protein CMC5_026730 [Chondromyces crocatus]
MRLRAWMVATTLTTAACDPTCTPGSSSRGGDTTAGAAYIATTRGVTVLEHGTVNEPADLASVLTGMALTSDGTLYLGAYDPLRLRNGRVTTLPELWDGVALAPDGKVWLATGSTVTLLHRDTVSKIPTPERARAIAIPRSGEVFVIGAHDLYRLDGQTWTKDDALARVLGPGRPLKDLLAGPSGELYVIAFDGILRRDTTGSWHPLPIGAQMLTYGQVSSKGLFPLTTRTGLHLVDENGTVRQLDVPLSPASVSAIAIDDADRLWLGAVSGLHILSADGKPLQHWPAGSLPGRAERIAIHREGPILPETPPAPVLGSVTGTVLLGGKPLAHAKVELCTDGAYGDDLCGRAGAPLVATTDAAGAFTLSQVPRDRYAFFTYERDGKQEFAPSRWIATAAAKRGRACCDTLTTDATWDLGTIEIP